MDLYRIIETRFWKLKKKEISLDPLCWRRHERKGSWIAQIFTKHFENPREKQKERKEREDYYLHLLSTYSKSSDKEPIRI